MCCILFTVCHPQYQLIVLSNRDEFIARPTLPSAWHNFPNVRQHSLEQLNKQSSSRPSKTTPILSGIDAHPSGGGTWLGITADGAFAALTNFTEEAPPPLPSSSGLTQYRSRGALVRDWLKERAESSSLAGEGTGEHQAAMTRYLEGVAQRRMEYPGFNLLIGSFQTQGPEDTGAVIGYVSNRKGSSGSGAQGLHGDREDDEVASGARILGFPKDVQAQGSSGSQAQSLCGLSNSVLDEPWVKVTDGKERLAKVLAAWDALPAEERHERRLIEECFGVMGTSFSSTISSREEIQSSIMVPPLQLPSKIPATNGLQSSNQPAWYATRTSTVLLIPRIGNTETCATATWVERDIFGLDAQGQATRAQGPGSERVHRWKLGTAL